MHCAKMDFNSIILFHYTQSSEKLQYFPVFTVIASYTASACRCKDKFYIFLYEYRMSVIIII